MSTAERQLLSRILRDAALPQALDWGITSEDFLTSEGRMIFEFINNVYRLPGNRGAKIGPNALKLHFPHFELCDDFGNSVELLCGEVRRRRLQIAAKETAASILEGVEGPNPLEVISDGQARLATLQALGMDKNSDVHFADGFSRIIQRYIAQRQGVIMAHGLWPWDCMNEATGGYQDDDYIIIYGRPKQKKSFVLAAMIAYAVVTGLSLVVYTKEMTPDNILKRVAACIMEVEYQLLRHALLPPEQEVELLKLEQYMRDLSLTKNFVVLSGQDVAHGHDTIAWLHAKIMKYKPDLVFVDGLYLMSDGSKSTKQDWVRVTSISRAARAMQLSTRVPLVATVQANRGAAKHGDANFDEIAYADALGQDTTCAIRVISDKHTPTISCILAGSREFKLHGFRIGGIPCTDFGFKEVLTEKDIEKAKEEDQGDREGADVEQHAKPRKPKAVRKPPPPTEEQPSRLQSATQEQLNGIPVP